MSKKNNRRLILNQPGSYQITVPGMLDESWSDWNDKMNVAVEKVYDGYPITTLTGTVDQAALYGVFRRNYALGIPLISVVCRGKMLIQAACIRGGGAKGCACHS